MTEENKLKEAAVEKYHTMASIVTMDKEEFITAMINFSKSQAAREYWQKEQSRVDVEGIKTEFFKQFGKDSFRGYPLEQCWSIWDFFAPLLSSKQEESKWISCEERLPENSETNVLAVGGNQTSITIMRGAYLHHILEEKGRTSLIPTHWMPLPAPPSKGK